MDEQIEASDNILDGRLLCSVELAAHALGLSTRTVNAYLAVKKIASRKIGRRRMVLVASLKSFVAHDQDGIASWSGWDGKNAT
jgi:hypothetical protein